MDEYNAKSCSALEKPFYRPIEASLRWCGLIKHEISILQSVGADGTLPITAFPQWPCLRVNTEKILDAIENGELPHGRDGKTVKSDDHVAKARLTVRHTDLKAWMAEHFPDQKPGFLFDETERNTHAAINADAFNTLQTELQAAKVRLQNAETEYKKLRDERNEYAHKLQGCLRAKEQEMPLSTKERNTLLAIITALCQEAKIDYTRPAKAAANIQHAADSMGISIGESTIESHLKKIPDALASRKK